MCTIEDAVQEISKTSPDPTDIILLRTSQEISPDFIDRCYDALSSRGLYNMLLVLPDESDLIFLSEDKMASWGWYRK
jgi:hypothetical protein